MATASPPENTCTEATIPLLQNAAALCWFDAGNFALFHKRRTELDQFFLEPVGKQNDWNIIQEMYDHFSGTKLITEKGALRALMERFRASESLRSHFNTAVGKSDYTVKEPFTKKSYMRRKHKEGSADDWDEEKEDDKQKEMTFLLGLTPVIKTVDDKTFVEKVDKDGWTYRIEVDDSEIEKHFKKVEKASFSIHEGNTSDVSDYIRGYINKNIFNTLKKKTEADIISSYLLQEKNDLRIIDILNEELLIDGKTDTLIVDTGYDKKEKSEQNYPEVLTIPLLNPDNTVMKNIIYTLDAIVVHTGGVHYFVLVRCGKTHDWILYDDMKVNDDDTLASQVKQQIFSSFPAKYEGISYDINKTAKLLFYSRFEVTEPLPQKSVAPKKPSASTEKPGAAPQKPAAPPQKPAAPPQKPAAPPQKPTGSGEADPTNPGQPSEAVLTIVKKFIKPQENYDTLTDTNEKERLDHIYKRFLQLAIFLETFPEGKVRIPGNSESHALGVGIAATGRKEKQEYKRMVAYIQSLSKILQTEYPKQIDFGTVGDLGTQFRGQTVTEKLKPSRMYWHVWGANNTNWFFPNDNKNRGNLGDGQAGGFQSQHDGVFGINTMLSTPGLTVQLDKPYNTTETPPVQNLPPKVHTA